MLYLATVHCYCVFLDVCRCFHARLHRSAAFLLHRLLSILLSTVRPLQRLAHCWFDSDAEIGYPTAETSRKKCLRRLCIEQGSFKRLSLLESNLIQLV